MRTYVAKKETVKRCWYLVDASQEILGRMAVEVAKILMGKNKPTFTRHVDTGDFVVIVNAAKVQTTGKKLEQKFYRHHTGWPGGLVERQMGELMLTKPEEIVMLAIRRMLPKSKLGKGMLKKLKVYSGPNHPHEAQNPTSLPFNTAKKA